MSLPPGSHVRPKPKTTDQARKLFSNDKIKNLTKLKTQEYISSFFTKAHSNFQLLSAVSPRFINYNIEKSFDPRVDPTQRQMQIARYFDKLKTIIPAILIVDGGVEPVENSIGSLSEAHVHGNNMWQGGYHIFRKIPLLIIAAGRDVDEADEMSGVISLMFNEMRNIAGGSYISGRREEGETWTITLPHGGVSVGALSEADVPEDPIEKIWYTETVLDVFFEDNLQIQRQIPSVLPGGVVVGERGLKQKLKPVLQIPDQIPINTQPVLFIKYFQDSYRVVLSDSNIATLSHTMILTPRKFGKVTIMVYDTKEADPQKRVIASKEVEIV
jgi:hypothetical protein